MTRTVSPLRRWITSGATAAATALCSAPCHAQLEALEETIPRMLAEDGAASIAVAVAVDGEIVWAQGFGWADSELRVPANEHTMYSLASISKPVTATGLMLLVERGLVDLDRPIDDYLGSTRINPRGSDASGATVRRVANHTAGLPLHYQFFYEDETYPRPPMDETIRRYASLVSPPGESWRYSNLGYGMLDYVIERVSGASFAGFMRQELFLPLGLTHMTVDIEPGMESLTATRYTPDGVPLPFYEFDHPGASAIYSSVRDLVRFGTFHLGQLEPQGGAVLSRSSLAEMVRPTAELAEGMGYGVGWGVVELPGSLRTITHNGGMPGVSTELVLLPEVGTVVAALSNSESALPNLVVTAVLDALYPGRYRSALGAPPPEVDEGPDLGPEFAPMPELVGAWTGQVESYLGSTEVVLRVAESGAAYVRMGSGLWSLLNDSSFGEGVLRGTFTGELQTPDISRRPYDLRLEVKLRGDFLIGSLTAVSREADRCGNAITHWIELKPAER